MLKATYSPKPVFKDIPSENRNDEFFTSPE